MNTENESKDLLKGDSAVEKTSQAASEAESCAESSQGQEKEIGGPQGLEPTRYGDWERKGICVDF